MAAQIQTRQVGDIRTAIAATLQRPDGTVVDVSGLMIKFAMFGSEGSAKVEETSTGATATDATAGEVQYTPLLADVDTEGTFYAYFITEDGSGKQDSFPVVKGEFKIMIEAAV